MKVTLVVLLLIGFAVCQNCELFGSYSCEGGSILGVNFGDDNDDDFFEYYSSSINNSDNAACTVVQQGTYEVNGETVTAEFDIDDEDCLITGANTNTCECFDVLEFTTSDNCATVTGPNGETCTPSASKLILIKL